MSHHVPCHTMSHVTISLLPALPSSCTVPRGMRRGCLQPCPSAAQPPWRWDLRTREDKSGSLGPERTSWTVGLHRKTPGCPTAGGGTGLLCLHCLESPTCNRAGGKDLRASTCREDLSLLPLSVGPMLSPFDPLRCKEASRPKSWPGPGSKWGLISPVQEPELWGSPCIRCFLILYPSAKRLVLLPPMAFCLGSWPRAACRLLSSSCFLTPLCHPLRWASHQGPGMKTLWF